MCLEACITLYVFRARSHIAPITEKGKSAGLCVWVVRKDVSVPSSFLVTTPVFSMSERWGMRPSNFIPPSPRASGASHFSLLLPIKQHKEACRQLGRLDWKSSTWHNLALIFLVPSKSYVIKEKTRFQDSKLIYDEIRYEVFWRVTLSRFVN